MPRRRRPAGGTNGPFIVGSIVLAAAVVSAVFVHLWPEPWPVGPVTILMITLSLGAVVHALVQGLLGKALGPASKIFAGLGVLLLVPVATYPLLSLLDVTTINDLKVNVLFALIALNSAIQLALVVLIRPRIAVRRPDDVVKIPLRLVAFSVVFILIIYWIDSPVPGIRACTGRCLNGVFLFGRKDNIFSTVWLTSMLLAPSFIFIFIFLARAAKVVFGSPAAPPDAK